jgi:hypothetical protein
MGSICKPRFGFGDVTGIFQYSQMSLFNQAESPSPSTSAKATLARTHYHRSQAARTTINLALPLRETETEFCLAVLCGLARKRGYFSRSSIFLPYFV